MTSSKPAASTFFDVSVICAGEPSNTEFSVRSAGRTLRSRSTMREIAIARRRGIRIARKGRDHALFVIADLPRPCRLFLAFRIGEMDEIAAHQSTRRAVMASAGLVMEPGHLPQPAMGHRRRERRNDEAAAEPAGKFDRRLRERSDIGRQRDPWPQAGRYVLEGGAPRQLNVPTGAYRTRDGWIMVALVREEQYVRLVDALGRRDLEADPRFADFAARRAFVASHRHRRQDHCDRHDRALALRLRAADILA